MEYVKVQRDSNFWDFESDKVLEGIYKSKESNQGQNSNSTIHHLDVDGKEEVFWGSTVLDGKLLSVETHFGFGTKVKITFLGREKGKGVQPYKNFEVEAWDDGAVNEKGENL